MMAAQAANRNVTFHTFQDVNQQNEFHDIIEFIQMNKVSIEELYTVLTSYEREREDEKEHLFDFVKKYFR